MEIKITQLQRRGTHVMFSVFIEGVKATRNKEVYDRKRPRTVKILSWERTSQQIDFTHAHVDGHWDGTELKMNPVEFSKWTHWPEAETHREAIMQAVMKSAHMGRVLKTLRKL